MSREHLLGDSEDEAAGSSPPQPQTLWSLSREASAAELRAGMEEDGALLRPWKPRAGVVTCCSLIVGTVLALGLLAGSIVLRLSDEARPPACRKSAAIALRSSANASVAPRVIIWSGMGHDEVIYGDLHSFSLDTRRWKKLRARPSRDDRGAGRKARASGSHSNGTGAPALPSGRWKAGVAQTSAPAGMLVTLGDSPLEGGSDVYDADAWLLHLASLKWQRANSSGEHGGRGPVARRAHSVALSTTSDGSSTLLVFGGRRRNKQLLGDLWEGRLDSWPHILWRRLSDPADGVVMEDATGSKKLVVFGGRDQHAYFSDLWAFDLQHEQWEEISPPPGSPRPPPRDHHAAVVAGGRMFVLFGRSGTSHDIAAPLGDLWSFGLATGWRLEAAAGLGLTPLPRFLFSSLLYAHNTTEGRDHLLIFGGEADYSCKLNDVWELCLQTMRWSQLSPVSWSRDRCRRIYG